MANNYSPIELLRLEIKHYRKHAEESVTSATYLAAFTAILDALGEADEIEWVITTHAGKFVKASIGGQDYTDLYRALRVVYGEDK